MQWLDRTTRILLDAQSCSCVDSDSRAEIGSSAATLALRVRQLVRQTQSAYRTSAPRTLQSVLRRGCRVLLDAYEAFLTQAIVDKAEDPERVGSVPREELAAGTRIYHLWHSRQRIAKSVGKVGNPRHFLLLRTNAEGQVEIGRVPHDSMDLHSNLPEVYLPQS
jgi:toxin ParE1/3/4